MFQKIINNDEASNEKAPHTPRPSQAAPQSTPAATSQSVASTPQPQSSAGGHRNRLSSDVEIKGSIRFQDELLIDGKVEGEITSTGSLSIQENARIRAEVKVGSVIIQGKVHGNITASKTVELRAGAEVVGDIKAAVLTMEAGAIFVGKSEVGVPSSQAAKAGTAKSKPANQPKKEIAQAS